jgi:hypothetical protein
LPAKDFSALDGWLRAGATAGTACAPAGTTNPTTPTMGTAGSGSPTMETGRGSRCDTDKDGDPYAPLVARDGETCYDFLTHGQSGANDTSKFDVPLDESYNQLYYSVPWPAGSLATRFGANFDNLKVLHHWLMFSSQSTNPPGTVSKDVTGTTLGEGTELIAGWAVGGCTTTFPEDVGVKLPSSGAIMIQWHHFNSTGTPQQDGSKVQICTVPAGGRPNVAGLTFLGTENFNGLLGMGPGEQSFESDCTNNSGGDIHILGFDPHMHTIGSHMKTTVIRAGGMEETIFDKPFTFNQQVNYAIDPAVVLKPNETLHTTCTFQNDTGANVAFGQSTHQEMCYQFTLSYPYGALNNGVLSLIGASNTCW